MDERILHILQFEVAFQCKCVLMAADVLNGQFSLPLVKTDSDVVWFALQSLLIAAANLSKLFWGSAGKREAEGLDLRVSLEVKGDSPLRDPDLRNDFEHFDTRVEDWFAKSEQHNFMGRTIGQHAGVVGVSMGDRFQWYDPSTSVVTFWNHSVALVPVIAEVQRILPLAQTAMTQDTPPIRPIREVRCGTCGHLTPTCTCLDSDGKPLVWE